MANTYDILAADFIRSTTEKISECLKSVETKMMQLSETPDYHSVSTNQLPAHFVYFSNLSLSYQVLGIGCFENGLIPSGAMLL
jgi:hypothetical protein